MATHEKKDFLLNGRVNDPSATSIPTSNDRTAKSRSTARRWFTASGIVATLLLVATIRGCHHHQDRGEKWMSHAPLVAAQSKPSEHVVITETQDHDGHSHLDIDRRDASHGMMRRQSASASVVSSAAAAASTVLVDYQVHQPVLTPDGATLDSGVSNGDAGEVSDQCQMVLMDYVFAYSYNEPFIAEYAPPDCEFNRVVMNFTVVSEGRQFDRLALMYFNDTEVWRTSTAEPTTPPGIRWTYLKDMTEYLSLWNAEQKLIFDLGNLITDVYTGDFNTTLTATFFQDASVDVETAQPADLIIPISARQSAADGVSAFTLPTDNATNTVSFPRNAKRALFSVSANGQSNEEFWWSNVASSATNTFTATAGTFPGYSPWREVQVLIDGQLAGVDWPFPVVFTGGVVPSLHRPIVGPDAFDLKEHEIDVTPWLGVLCDGAEHTFTIYVAGLQDSAAGDEAYVTQSVGSYWLVTGKIFVWLDDDADSITTGTAPVISAAEPVVAVSNVYTKSSNGTVNETLTYDTAVSRSYSVSATLTRQNLSSTVGWTQSLSYSNQGYVWAEGYSQINDFLTSGTDAAVAPVNGSVGANYKAEYKYPLYCNTTVSYSAEGNLTIFAQLIQGQNVYIEGAAVFPDGLEAFALDGVHYAGSLASNSKDGVAYFFEYADDTVSSGYGSTDETFTFGGFTVAGGSVDATPDTELYSRHVVAANSTITLDDEVLDDTDVAAAGTTTAVSDGVYAQSTGGGSGAPRLFMNRHSL